MNPQNPQTRNTKQDLQGQSMKHVHAAWPNFTWKTNKKRHASRLCVCLCSAFPRHCSHTPKRSWYNIILDRNRNRTTTSRLRVQQTGKHINPICSASVWVCWTCTYYPSYVCVCVFMELRLLLDSVSDVFCLRLLASLGTSTIVGVLSFVLILYRISIHFIRYL